MPVEPKTVAASAAAIASEAEQHLNNATKVVELKDIISNPDSTNAQVDNAAIELTKLIEETGGDIYSVEEATANYLIAIQERTAFSDSPEAASKLATSLENRTEALSNLVSGSRNEIENAVSESENKVREIEIELSELNARLSKNDQQRHIYSDINLINDSSLVDQKKTELKKSLDIFEAELSALGHKAH